jgi:hypothetical protein
MQPRPKKLLRQLRDAIRARYDSYPTKQAYVGQIRSCVLFHGKPHPSDTGAYEVDALPTHLAVAEHVAASTQNQAFRALPFLYRGVLPKDVGLVDPPLAKETQRLAQGRVPGFPSGLPDHSCIAG